MSKLRTTRAFGAGVLLGLMIGSAGMAAASFGYKAWSTVSVDYKNGFVAGFLTMANLARNLQPGGWVDQKYPHIPKAKPVEWSKTLDELYAKPENRKYTVTGMLQAVARDLEKKYGPAQDPMDRTRDQMLEKLRALGERNKNEQPEGEAGKAGEGESGAPLANAPGDDKAQPGPNDKGEPKALPRTDFPNDRKRKWCRCDGTDPKLARAARQANATEKQKASSGVPAASSGTAGSTGPAAPTGPAGSPAKP
jgi:hypothetical protein